MLGAGEVQALARSRHGHVEKPPLLGDDVLPSPHKGLEHRRRQLESLRAAPLRQPSLHERRHEDRIELESLGLMDGHDRDGVSAALGRRRRLVLSR